MTGGSTRTLTLLTRAYCSLCDEMLREAASVARANGMPLDVIDVDGRADLVARWDTLVPVLFLGPAESDNELCHYHFDASRVSDALARARAVDPPVAAPSQIG